MAEPLGESGDGFPTYAASASKRVVSYIPGRMPPGEIVDAAVLISASFPASPEPGFPNIFLHCWSEEMLTLGRSEPPAVG